MITNIVKLFSNARLFKSGSVFGTILRILIMATIKCTVKIIFAKFDRFY